ncbi:Protein POLAR LOCALIZATION DURING ASYMMETRIC DIVISION AND REDISTRIBUTION [Euphorbia peplus]|nr:Protein POLAR LOCALIZATION DURING ASYMMETRIC DIVISION AND REDISTRIBUTION [Euphorbia peplus]
MNPNSISHKSPNPSPFPPNFHPPLRISDILFSGDDEIPMGRSLDFSGRIKCSSFRVIFARWVSRLRRSRVKRVSGESFNLQADEKEKELPEKMRCSMDGLNERNLGVSSSSSTPETGRSGDCGNFNLGVGCCLVYLLAASKNELCKMTEMRMQMERLLRDELHKRDELNAQSEPIDMFAFCGTNAQESPISTVTVCDQSCQCETSEREECLEEEEEGMDQLEAELEAELELLQHHLDTEKPLNPSEHMRIKTDDETENTSSSKSQALSYEGEVIDPQYQDSEHDYGVPPDELERRLHELLESRQQEEIRELESALECLKHKLLEKELEAAWWRDTANIISQHSSDPSCFVSEHDQRLA